MLKKLFIAGAAIVSASAWAGYMQARSLWRSWGVDLVEAGKVLPGDDLVPEPQEVDTRVIEIAAPPAQVWPWLVQLGYGRAGWYSYDQLDMNRPSADRILPEFQTLNVGDVVPTDPRGGLLVKALEPERSLVLYIDRELARRQWGPVRLAEAPAAEATEPPVTTEAAPVNLRATGAYLDRAMAGDFAASWAVILEPTDAGTRLVERFRVRMEPPQGKAVPAFARSLLGFGVFVMLRRQMLGIRDRAEGRPIRRRIVATPAVAPTAQPG